MSCGNNNMNVINAYDGGCCCCSCGIGPTGPVGRMGPTGPTGARIYAKLRKHFFRQHCKARLDCFRQTLQCGGIGLQN